MAILWAGGEDLSFPVIGTAAVTTTAGLFRAGWARCCLTQSKVAGGAYAKSDPFPGGAVTSAWLSFEQNWGVTVGGVGLNFVSFGLSGGTFKSLGIGCDTVNGAKLVIYKYDGTTRTQLASEAGASIAAVTQRFDVQVSNYGVSATVNVYLNGVSVLSFTGDVTVSGMTNFDSVFLPFYPNIGNSSTINWSEIFVMDSDTRAVQGLQTEALVATGTTNNWSNNTVGNINGINFSDANPANVNTTAKDQQYTVTTPTPVTYSVLGMVISARLARPAAAVPTQVKLGYGNGAGGSFGTGAAKTPTVGFANYQQIDAINPVTGVAFTSSDLASLQLDIQSA